MMQGPKRCRRCTCQHTIPAPAQPQGTSTSAGPNTRTLHSVGVHSAPCGPPLQQSNPAAVLSATHRMSHSPPAHTAPPCTAHSKCHTLCDVQCTLMPATPDHRPRPPPHPRLCHPAHACNALLYKNSRQMKCHKNLSRCKLHGRNTHTPATHRQSHTHKLVGEPRTPAHPKGTCQTCLKQLTQHPTAHPCATR